MCLQWLAVPDDCPQQQVKFMHTKCRLPVPVKSELHLNRLPPWIQDGNGHKKEKGNLPQ